MEEVSKTPTKYSADNNTKKSIALAFFVLGLASLILIIIRVLEEPRFYPQPISGLMIFVFAFLVIFTVSFVSAIYVRITLIESAGSKTKNSFALTSFILGMIILTVIALMELGVESLLYSDFNFYVFIVFLPFIAIICGIIALIKNENKSLYLVGITLATLFLFFWAITLFLIVTFCFSFVYGTIVLRKSADSRIKNAIAPTSLILAIVSLIAVLLIEYDVFYYPPTLLEIAVFITPFFAVIFGVIALIIKQNKAISLAGIVLGVLIVWFIFNMSPTPTWSGETKSGLAGLKAGIAICCAISTNQLQTTAGSDICSPEIYTILPEHKHFNLPRATDLSYAVTAQCNTDTPTITATINYHRKKACNGVWTITEKEITIPPGC